ncbi:hypothetical protein OAQ84_00790 [Bdellovibrionales bacterium]|nr:hypothetical protein [Bdellovibrionales bacterium]
MNKIVLYGLIGSLSLLIHSKTRAQVGLSEMNLVFEAVSAAYSEKLKKEGGFLRLNPLARGFSPWDFVGTVRASYARLETEGIETELAQWGVPEGVTTVHTVNVYRGYANLKGVTRDGVALVICHELGHAFAQGPRKIDGFPMEGEADFYATSSCIRRVFKFLAAESPAHEKDLSVAEVCKRDGVTDPVCPRILEAIKSSFVIEILYSEKVQTYLNAEDKSKVSFMDTSLRFYPPPQCRVETLIAGTLGRERPACWYLEERLAEAAESRVL